MKKNKVFILYLLLWLWNTSNAHITMYPSMNDDELVMFKENTDIIFAFVPEYLKKAIFLIRQQYPDHAPSFICNKSVHVAPHNVIYEYIKTLLVLMPESDTALQDQLADPISELKHCLSELELGKMYVSLEASSYENDDDVSIKAINLFSTNSGTALMSGGNLNVLGGSNINTTGSGATVTINLNDTINTGTTPLNISTDAVNTTVNIATGAGIKTTTLGSTNSTSSTTIQAGTGGISLNGTTTTITQPANDDSTKVATTAYVDNSNSYRLLSTQTITSPTSTVAFTSSTGLNSNYTSFQVKWYNVTPATSGTTLNLVFSTLSAGGSWIASGYYGAAFYVFSAASSNTSAVTSVNATALTLTPLFSTTTNYASSGEINITNIGASVYPCVYGRTTSLYTTGPESASSFCGGYVQTTGCNSFQLYFSSGNIATGTFKLYGVL